MFVLNSRADCLSKKEMQCFGTIKKESFLSKKQALTNLLLKTETKD